LNTRLKCLLLDDELPSLRYLKILCEQLPELEVVKTFNSPASLLHELPHLEFDLCILDIEMPETNGLQIASLLNGKPVIFTTAYKEYAADAFDLNAIDYVRKPVSLERLQQAVQKAHNRLNTVMDGKFFMKVNTDKGKALIYFNQLCYVRTSEIDSRDKMAQLADGTTLIVKNISFEKLLQLLPENDFVRINKKELIAIKSVQLFSFDEVTTNIQSPSGLPLKLVLSDVYRNDMIRKIKI
jgi:DNA-binding LytR/AlgR family response regulator